jgi:hypothetical protein
MKIAAFLLTASFYPTLLFAAPIVSGHASAYSISGSTNWVSRHGSVMVLDIGADGLVQGYFVNNAPGRGCRGIPYALNGRMTGDVIAFQVRWRNGVADCMAETQWRGHLQPSRNGGLEIVAEWQRSSTVATVEPQNDVPQRGMDFFTYQAMPGLPTHSEP